MIDIKIHQFILGIQGLSDREREIISLVLQGKTSPEIGVYLKIAHKTCKFHLTNIYKKMKVRNRTSLALSIYNNFIKERYDRGFPDVFTPEYKKGAQHGRRKKEPKKEPNILKEKETEVDPHVILPIGVA